MDSMTDSGAEYWMYWVAYRHGAGLDAATASLDAPLTTADQLVALAERIGREAGQRDVVILSWQWLAGAEREIPAVDAAMSTPDAVAPVGVRAMLAATRVLEAADRLGLTIASLLLNLRGDSPDLSLHCEPQASPDEAERLLAELGAEAQPEARRFRGDGDDRFETRTATVAVSGTDLVEFKMFCGVAAEKAELA
jgi:hypothetical protein